MEEDQFEISFDYKGKEYRGIVTPGGRESVTFVVQYSIKEIGQFERTVEVCVSNLDDEDDDVIWAEQQDEVGQLATDPELIRLIGEEIEANQA